MLVLWVFAPQFGLKCAEICTRFSVTRTWEISDWGLKATIQCIGFVGVIFSGWLILPPRFTGWFAGSALTKDGILLRGSEVGWPSCLSCWLPGAKQSDPYKAFPGTFMLTTAISKVALDVVKNVEIICWGWKSSRVIRNCQSRRGEEEKHGPSLLVGIIVHCTFQQEAYSKNIHWNLMDIYIYWLMVWNMFFIFPYLGIIIPTDQYFSGGLKPPTSISMSFIPHLPGERLDSSDTLSLSLSLAHAR